MSLIWEKASLGHICDLQGFRCLPAWESPSPTWVDEVENFIRGRRPPLKDPDYLGLAFAEDTLVAVCAHQRDHWTEWLIQAIGVASHARGQGAGRQALAFTLEEIGDRAAQQDARVVQVECLIHTRNRASQGLFFEAGFRSHGLDAPGSDFETWQYELLTPAVSDDWEQLTW